MSGNGDLEEGEAVDLQYDENTGQWYDPNTGEAYENPYGEGEEYTDDVDPNAPPVYAGYEDWGYDPQTGAHIDPQTGAYVDLSTGYNIDPETGYHIDPATGLFFNPETGETFNEQQAEEWAEQQKKEEEEYNYDDEEKVDTQEYMDIDRQIKANQANGRFERQSAFAGQEMKVLWMVKLDERVKHKNKMMMLIALIGILLMMIHIELNFDKDLKKINGDSGLAIAMKFIIGFSTIALLCALFDYYQLQVYIWRKYDKPAGEAVPPGWPNEFLYPFLVEAFVCSLHPVPYLFRDKLGMLMFLRVYLVVRVIRDHSDIYIKRHTILNQGYKDRGGPKFNSVLVMRTIFDTSPGLCIATLVFFFTIVLGWCNFVCERESPYLMEDFNYFKAVWGTTFMLFTGDVKFETHSDFGRLVELITLMVGVVLYAMILAVMHNKIVMKRNELYGEECIRTHNRQLERQKIAAILLQNWWRLERLKRKNRVTTQDFLDFATVCTRHMRTRERLDCQDKNSMDPMLDKLLAMERQLNSMQQNISDIRITQDLLTERSQELAATSR